MATITYPNNITINLPSSIAPSLARTLLEMNSWHSLLMLLLTPLLATLTYLYDFIHLVIKIIHFTLRTKITFPFIWAMDDIPLQQMPITFGGPLFWLTCAFVVVFIARFLWRAILSLPQVPRRLHGWPLEICSSRVGRDLHKLLLLKLGYAWRSQDPRHEQSTTTGHIQNQHFAGFMPRFSHLSYLVLLKLKLVWADNVNKPAEEEIADVNKSGSHNTSIDGVERHDDSSVETEEDDMLAFITGTSTDAANPEEDSEDIWEVLEQVSKGEGIWRDRYMVGGFG